MGKLSTTGYRSRGRLADKFPTLAETIKALGPVGYWKLNETSGTTAADSSGNSRNGTYTGNFALANITGPDGVGYVRLQDTVGYVIVTDNNAFSMNTDGSGMTIFALIRATVVDSQFRFIIAKGNTGQFEWGWGINGNASGRINLTTHNLAGSTIRRIDSDNSEISADTWYALAVYCAPPTTTSTMELRKNSNTQLSPTTTTGFSGTYSNGTADVVIGFRGDLPGSLYWRGYMAHVAIFAGNPNLSAVFTAADREGWY